MLVNRLKLLASVLMESCEPGLDLILCPGGGGGHVARRGRRGPLAAAGLAGDAVMGVGPLSISIEATRPEEY